MTKQDSTFKKIGSKLKPSQMGQRIIYSVIAIMVILLIILGVYLHHYVVTSLQPLDPHNHDVVEINVPANSSPKKIGEILQNSDVIKNGIVFEYYVKSHNVTDLKSGYYQLDSGMNIPKITNKLRKGGNADRLQIRNTTLKIHSGDSLNQVAAEVQKRTDFSKNEFMRLADNQTFYEEMKGKFPTLLSDSKSQSGFYEGYLAPGTYKVVKGETLKMILSTMVQSRDEQLRPMYKMMNRDKLSVKQTLTLASSVNQAGVSYQDQHMMSDVLRNRLGQGKEKNLSKGPFNSPSVDSVKAVLYPKKVDKHFSYYFVNPTTHKVYYAKNFKENTKNIKAHK